MEDLFGEVLHAIDIAIENRHRFLVFLCSSNPKEALKIGEKIIEKNREKTGKSDLLIVGRENFLEIAKYLAGELIHWKDSAQVLGRTFSALIMDFSESFHPNDLGIVVETIEEGGAIVVISPPLEKWFEMKSRWHEDIISEPYSIEDVVGRFYRRFIEKTLNAEGVIVYDVDRAEIIKKYEFKSAVSSREEIVLPSSTRIKKKLYKLCATQDQVRVLSLFESFFERERERKAVVITADRGRGKTAVLGIVTPALISKLQRILKRPVRVLVVAPTPQAIQTYFKFLMKAMKRQGMKEFFVKKSEELITVLNSKYARVEYVVPRRAIEERDFADILIIDEAAGIEAPVLLKITENARNMIFSTTVHGYEGTGRSFNIRFLRKLESDENIEVEKIHMSEPIRYGNGDPIEKWLYDILLLNAQPVEIDERDLEKIKNLELEFKLLDKDEVVRNDKLLREYFGIYVLAHYRNKPSDLAILLDTPNHIPFAVFVDGKVVCSIHAAVEGGLDENVIEKIRNGYKPKGQIIPDLALKHFWNYDFAKERGLRIVRIATHPNVMNFGIGSFALNNILKYAESNSLSWVGAGFGISNELMSFWLKNGFVPIHITPQRNEVSGEYTAIVLRPIKESREIEKMNREFIRRFIEYLGDELSDLEIKTALMVLKTLKREIDTYLPNFGYVEIERLRKYFEGFGFYEYISDLARPLVRFYYSKLGNANLDEEEERVLVAKCLQLLPWREIEVKEKYGVLLNALKKVWNWFLDRKTY
ncbi:MAG: tRNA(Met) cytidine acetyltransferase TmcA [Archaeoglobaceae archaeon]|nr:tRNA(Met) cytidine acetyltransferase TmcA [Archaeoglobaceae archaeon]MDW7989478.1 tRNA(Met) cytidine acetyltransferase TmcA [Archaeoglobaceae archaeon]